MNKNQLIDRVLNHFQNQGNTGSGNTGSGGSGSSQGSGGSSQSGQGGSGSSQGSGQPGGNQSYSHDQIRQVTQRIAQENNITDSKMIDDCVNDVSQKLNSGSPSGSSSG